MKKTFKQSTAVLVALVILSLSMYSNAFAAGTDNVIWLGKGYNMDGEYSYFNEGLANIEKDGKWGYININGKMVVPAIYDEAYSFRDGLALVKKGDKWDFIDKTGKVTINLKGYAHSFSNGLAKIEVNGKWGIIDNKGKTIIPTNFDSVADISEGFSRMTIDGKYGFVSDTGKEVVPAIYDSVSYFKNGYAIVSIEEVNQYYNVSYKNGYIDTSGKLVIPMIYDDAFFFSEGLAHVAKEKKHGYIDNTGKEIIPFIYDDAGNFNQGLARVEKDGKWGLIDKTGKVVAPIVYEYIYYDYSHNDQEVVFINGVARVRKDDKWLCIDKTGKEIVPTIYDYIEIMDEELILVMKDEKYGLIDRTGKAIVPLIYDYISDYYKTGVISVSKDGKAGFIDKTGKVVIPMTYDGASDFYNGMAVVYKNDKVGLIDKKGNVIMPIIYDEISLYGGKDVIWVKKDGVLGITPNPLNYTNLSKLDFTSWQAWDSGTTLNYKITNPTDKADSGAYAVIICSPGHDTRKDSWEEDSKVSRYSNTDYYPVEGHIFEYTTKPRETIRGYIVSQIGGEVGIAEEDLGKGDLKYIVIKLRSEAQKAQLQGELDSLGLGTFKWFSREENNALQNWLRNNFKLTKGGNNYEEFK